MDSYFHVEGLPPFDGDYPIDLSYFTNAELHTIKKIAGVRAGELEDSFKAGDNDLIVAFAVVALQRAGRQMEREAIDVIWNAAVGKITLVAGDEEEADAGPPVQPPTAREENKSGGEKSVSSGIPLRSDGDDPQEISPSFTGSQGSATIARSVPEILPR